MRADEIRVGDVILPPARELSLWMRRHVAENGLPECALHLTVTEVYEGAPDKRGRWLTVKCEQAPEWFHGREGTGKRFPFTFKARPETPWPLIKRGETP